MLFFSGLVTVVQTRCFLLAALSDVAYHENGNQQQQHVSSCAQPSRLAPNVQLLLLHAARKQCILWACAQANFFLAERVGGLLGPAFPSLQTLTISSGEIGLPLLTSLSACTQFSALDLGSDARWGSQLLDYRDWAGRQQALAAVAAALPRLRTLRVREWCGFTWDGGSRSLVAAVAATLQELTIARLADDGVAPLAALPCLRALSIDVLLLDQQHEGNIWGGSRPQGQGQGGQDQGERASDQGLTISVGSVSLFSVARLPMSGVQELRLRDVTVPVTARAHGSAGVGA